MSRIGRAPITIPAGVELKITDGNHVTVKGPKGTLERQLPSQMSLEVEGNVLHVKRPDDEKQNRSLHGLTRTLLNDMVVGVTEGFSKTLEIQGVGYRAVKEGKNLVMNLGYSHQVTVPETDEIQIDVPDANHIVIRVSTSRRSASLLPTSATSAPPSPTRARASNMPMKWSAARKARRVSNKEVYLR